MTTELKKAFKEIEKLSDEQQNAIASLLVEEMSWNNSFENSRESLLNLAEEALAEYQKGKTKPMNEKLLA